MTAPIRLRAHHLGCVQGFAGHGYDAPFTARLRAIALSLRNGLSTPIVLVDGIDDVCDACPHRDGTSCAKDAGADARVRSHDAAFCKALGLPAQGHVTIADVSGRIVRDPSTRRAIRDACSGCPWTGACLFFPRLAG